MKISFLKSKASKAIQQDARIIAIPAPFFFRPKPTRKAPRAPGRFSVQVRRGGKFRTVGRGLTARQAFTLGRARVERTLAATFKIEGNGVRYKTPKGFRKKVSKKEGTVFIEKRRRRLSTRGEVGEIQLAKLR